MIEVRVVVFAPKGADADHIHAAVRKGLEEGFDGVHQIHGTDERYVRDNSQAEFVIEVPLKKK